MIRRARTSHAVAALHISGVYGGGVTDFDTSSHMLVVIGGVVVRILKKISVRRTLECRGALTQTKVCRARRRQYGN